MSAYDLRHSVKPGITGLAQVMGRYRTTAESKLNFDLLYIYNYSLLLDAKILLQTVRVVLQGESSAKRASRARIPLTLDRIRRINEAIDPGNSRILFADMWQLEAVFARRERTAATSARAANHPKAACVIR